MPCNNQLTLLVSPRMASYLGENVNTTLQCNILPLLVFLQVREKQQLHECTTMFHQIHVFKIQKPEHVRTRSWNQTAVIGSRRPRRLSRPGGWRWDVMFLLAHVGGFKNGMEIWSRMVWQVVSSDVLETSRQKKNKDWCGGGWALIMELFKTWDCFLCCFFFFFCKCCHFRYF